MRVESNRKAFIVIVFAYNETIVQIAKKKKNVKRMGVHMTSAQTNVVYSSPALLLSLNQLNHLWLYEIVRCRMYFNFKF